VQTITGTQLASTWAQPSREVRPKLEVRWNGVNWTDETAYLLSARVAGSLIREPLRLPMLGAVQPMVAEFVLLNQGRRFSPENAGGNLYAYLQYGFRRIAIRFSMGIKNSLGAFEYLRQFTGFIDRAQPYTDASDQGPREMVQLACIDNTDLLQQAPLSTVLYENTRADLLLEDIITAAGIGDYTLATGRSVIPFAWLDSEKAWTECQLIAQADGGWCYCDKTGRFRFETLDQWLGVDTPVATLSADRWWHLGQDEGWENAYTAVEVVYTPRAKRPIRTVYEAHEVFALQPGERREIVAEYDAPCAVVFEPTADADYQARGAGNRRMTEALSLTMTAYAQRATIIMENTDPDHALYVVGLTLRGQPVEADEGYEERVDADADVLATWWRGADAKNKVWREMGNPYLQTRHQARRRAGVLRDRLQIPRKLLRLRASACPFLEYGDLVTVQHDMLDVEGLVLSISVQWSVGGLYEGEYVILPNDGLYSEAPYFVIGESEYADPSEAVFW